LSGPGTMTRILTPLEFGRKGDSLGRIDKAFSTYVGHIDRHKRYG
jgi:hypothetical protein